ncbi:MAG: transglutaminase TgpA family protein, partial [Myxococcota bacterium]
RHPAWSVVVLLFVAAGLFGLAFRGVLDLVIAAVSFATLVTGQRLLAEPGPSTDQQVLLASLLLMAGAAALSGELWFAFCLLAFGLFACLHLGLAAVEGPVERDEDLPVAPVIRQVSVGVALALVGGVTFFVLFPRLSWNLAARRSGPSLLGGMTGMTDRVRLGGGGDIKTSARIVLRARLEPSPGAQRLDRYWVGRRFDAFDGREWRGTGTARAPQPIVHVAAATAAVVQRIELLPAYESQTLVGLEQPVSFGQATAIGTSGSRPTRLVKVEGEEVRFAEDAHSYTYVVQSSPVAQLLEDEPAVLARNTRLPDTLDPRVRELAATIVGGEQDPERVAAKLESWLRSNLAYTLELGGDVEDPLADFLFVRRAGHCEHFATALAVMLRTRGVPARVVGGFFGGELMEDRYVVRAGDAHAWVEAYSPERGWRTFDATPDDGRPGQPRALLAKLVDTWERLEELWRSKVLDYTIIDQWTFVRSLIRPPTGTSPDVEPSARQPLPSTKTPVEAGLVALGVAMLVFFAWSRLSGRRSVHPAANFLAQLERRLAAAGVQFQPGEDIEQLPQRLAREHHPLARAVAAASRRYLEARFGGRPLSADEQKRLLNALAPG